MLSRNIKTEDLNHSNQKVAPINTNDNPDIIEKSQEKIEKASVSWFYGQGLGETILNIGGVVIYPPFAIYLIGKAGLQLSGCEECEATNLLPEVPREGFLLVYDGVTSVPGRLNAEIAGVDYQEKNKEK